MPRPAAAELERIEIEAFEDVVESAREAGTTTEASFCRFGTASAFLVPGSPSPVFNRLVGLGVESVASSVQLDAALDHMSACAERFTVSLAPDARPARLLESLLARGFEPGYPWMKFHRDARPLPRVDTPYAIRPVTCASDTEAFCEALTADWGTTAVGLAAGAAQPGRRGWAAFVAWDGTRPVGAGAAFVRDGRAWLGFGTTVAEHRRRGVQRALLAARIDAVRELGARIVTVETGVRRPGMPDASYRNLSWAGFREAYVRTNLTSPMQQRAGVDDAPRIH